MTYSVGSYTNGYYPITITHNSDTTNHTNDWIDITINSKNSSCNKSASISGHLNVGYFNVTFDLTGTITYGKWVEVYIDCNGQTQTVAVLETYDTTLNQRTQPIWHSTLDTGSNAGTCPSRSFTVKVKYDGVTSATITSATSGTINNTCRSDDFNITCKVVV